LHWLILLSMAVSWHPQPPTVAELMYKAKQKSVSKVCNKPRKTKAVKELCKRWEK